MSCIRAWLSTIVTSMSAIRGLPGTVMAELTRPVPGPMVFGTSVLV